MPSTICWKTRARGARVSILSDFEDRIGRAVEGAFAGVFRSPVQPAELAKALGREMDRGRKVGVGKVYAPTVYTVLLSRADDDNLGGFAETLAGELATYLVGHARERGYDLTMRPIVRFMVEQGLRLGRFEVYGELLSPEEAESEMAAYSDEFRGVEPPLPHPDDGFFVPVERGEVPPVSPVAAVVAGSGHADAPVPEPHGGLQSFSSVPTVTISGIAHDVVLRGERMVVGRLSECDIHIPDANISRHHATFVREGGGWAIEDAGSTNGTYVNGERVEHQRLRNGDTITIGVSELNYHEPRG
jgi:hypothetical protein